MTPKTFVGDVLSRALASYCRTTSAAIDAQPGNSSGAIIHDGLDYVVLRNDHGVLAIYRIQNSGQLKLMKRPPAGLLEQL